MVKTSTDKRWDTFECKMYEIRVELRNQRDDFRQLLERLERHSRRRRGHPRLREESGGTVEPTTAHIAMRKSEEVEEKMVGKDWEVGEENCTFDKTPEGDMFVTEVEASHPLYDAVRSFTAPLYDTYPDEEENKSRIDWGMDLASDKEPPLERNAGEATADVVVPNRDTREGIFSLLTGSCEGEEKTRGSDKKLRNDEHWGRPPEKNVGRATATVEVEGRTCGLGASFFSLAANNCNREREGKNVAADWSSMQLDPVVISLGQAQVKVSRYMLDIKREVLKEKSAEKNSMCEFGWAQEKVDLSFNPMGQAHNFIITPQIFTNSGGGFKGKRSAATIVDLFSTTEKKLVPIIIEKGSKIEGMLEAVDWQLRGVSSTLVLDVGYWFSELYSRKLSLFYILATFIVDHMKAVVPETNVKLQNDNGTLKMDAIINVICTLLNSGDHDSSLVGHISRVVKLIKLIVGVGWSCGNGLMPLKNISVTVKSPCFHEWDPGGLKRGVWNPSDLKQSMSIQESANTFVLGSHENQFMQYHHDEVSHSSIVKHRNITSILYLMGFPFVMTAFGNLSLPHGVVIEFGKGFTIFEKRELIVLAQSMDNIYIYEQRILATPIQEKYATNLLLFLYPICFCSIRQPQSLIKEETVQNEIEMSASAITNFLDDFDYAIHSRFRPLQGNGQLNHKKDTYQLNFKALFFHMTNLYRGVCNGYVSKLGEYTWLVLFFGGKTIIVLGKKRNWVLLFHNYISHQVMPALFVIPTNEWGAQNGDDHENVIQARLQNWKEVVSNGGKLTKKFLYSDYWMKLKGQVGYGVRSYQSSITLDFGGWEALQQWDPGGTQDSPVTCLALSLCFPFWDPRGRPLCQLFYHLEDKVNFEGGSIDENRGVAELGQTNRFGRVYSSRGKRGNVSK